MGPRSVWIYTVCQGGFKYFSRRQKQTTFFRDICALRVNKCELSVCTVLDFHEMHARLRDSNNLSLFTNNK